MRIAIPVLVASLVFGTNPAEADLVPLDGGTFQMGSAAHYREEGPVRRVTVGPFRIGKTEVTNADFAAFIAATGYVTTAETALDPADYPNLPVGLLVPGSMVFAQPESRVEMANPNNWWRYVAGASWRQPTGPGSSIDGLDDHPVVQVSPEDAEAYAAWAAARLPTEAEWEFAARGGLDGAEYVWGDVYDPVEGWRANTWQGTFPQVDDAADGHHGAAAVGSYAANDFGLYDMAGNVWEIVGDWWVPGHPDQPENDPAGPPEAYAARFAHPEIGAMRVVKGGSWLCAPSYCLRYRPAARQPAERGIGSNHIGFRIAQDMQ